MQIPFQLLTANELVTVIARKNMPPPRPYSFMEWPLFQISSFSNYLCPIISSGRHCLFVMSCLTDSGSIFPVISIIQGIFLDLLFKNSRLTCFPSSLKILLDSRNIFRFLPFHFRL